MKDRVFLHSEEATKKMVIRFLLSLIPLVLYGLYKNGWLLYQRDLLSLWQLPKIIYLLLISLGIYTLCNKFIRKKNFWNLDLVYALIVSLFMPPNINLGIYALGFFVGYVISSLIERKLTFNKMAFWKLLIIMLVVIFSDYTYLNAAEELNLYHFNYWNLIWGRVSGGIGTSSVILGVVVLALFSFFNNYKTIITCFSLIIFSLLSLITMGLDANIFLNSNVILGFILLNVDSKSTPHNKIAMIIYGLLLGIFTFGIYFFSKSPESVFIACLILSFCSSGLDKIVEKW